MKDKLDILAAFYGQKLAIREFIEEKKERQTEAEPFEVLIARDTDRFVAHDLPKFVSDVTIPVCFALCTSPNNADGTLPGLTLNGSKQSIIGFYNPVPPCYPVEHERPTLCIVYRLTKQSEDGSEKSTEVITEYFRDTQ